MLKSEIAGTGPDVVLVHGLGASRFSWRATVAKLQTRFRTHAVDLAGFGESETPKGFSSTARAQAAVVAEYLLAQGLTNVILVGHSMGGAVCLYLARDAAGLNIPTPAKMVLLAPVAGPPPLPPLTPAGLALLGKISIFINTPLFDAVTEGRLLAEKVLEAAYADQSKITPQQRDGYALGLSRRSQIKAFLAHAPKLFQIAFSAKQLKSIPAKTLVIAGDADRIIPFDASKALASGLGHAAFHPVKACGHIPHEEAATEVNAAIASFLA